MTLIAISFQFYEETGNALFSSLIQVSYYVAIGFTGLFGGLLLQRFCQKKVGVFCSFLSCCIVFFVSFIDDLKIVEGLIAIFLIFFLSGIEHPSNFSFFTHLLAEEKKLGFYSFLEGTNACISIVSPALASFIISHFSVHLCYWIDGFTYFLIGITWLMAPKTPSSTENRLDWALGFKSIMQIKELRTLTAVRFINNISFVFYVTSLPFVIAFLSFHNADDFAWYQSYTASVQSFGFIALSLIVAKALYARKYLSLMVMMASLLGFLAVFTLLLAPFHSSLLFISALIAGAGTYCFRLSGMTLGQAFTPKQVLGPVIIAGDTLVRLWSLGISLLTVWIFNHGVVLHEPTSLLVLVIPGLCLLSPNLSLKLAKKYKSQDQAHDIKAL